MKLFVVLCAVVAVAVAKPGYLPGGLAGLGLAYPYGLPAGVVVGGPGGFEDAATVAQQNAQAVAQGAHAAAQGAAAAAEGAAAAREGAVAGAAGIYAYGPAAPVVLTAQGVPVDTPEVQAARAANALAHLQAKGLLG